MYTLYHAIKYIIWLYISYANTGITKSVSYTHLDVYKRQVKKYSAKEIEINELNIQFPNLLKNPFYKKRYKESSYLKTQICLLYTSAFVFAFEAKAVVCSSACFGVYEKIPFLFCFLW